MSLDHKILLDTTHRLTITLVLALAAMMLPTMTASGQLIFYHNQEYFHSQVKFIGKVLKGIEDFEEMTIPVPKTDLFDDPLEFGVPNLPDGFPFPQGMTGIPSLKIQSNSLEDPTIPSPAGEDGLIAIPFGALGFSSDAVISNFTNTGSLDLIFSEGKSGVGFNPITAFSETTVTISVYSMDNVLLGITEEFGNPQASNFVGVWSPVPIGRINIKRATKGSTSVGADNIEAWQVAEPFNCGDKGAGSCFKANGTPACDNLECCEAVCAIDPICCSTEWDHVCVGEADDLCSKPPPNDLCADAIPVQVGDVVAGTTNGATADDEFPTCVEEIFAPGVWYSVIGTGNTMTVTTCGGTEDHDTKINVYCGSCAEPTCVGGNDDECNVFSLHSTVTFCAQGGVEYLILVYGFGLEVGDFDLTIDDDGVSCAGPGNCLPQDTCPWDLDGSGSVGTGDLLTLFTQWGTDGPADFDESGAVGTGDLLILFANWGPCP